jgi:glucokinase
VPVHVHNDAVCVAVGEHWRGAGRGRANVLGMVVSTGVGGGLILDGRLINGAGGQAGHIGHVIVEPDGPRCPCGARGCLTVLASGPKLTEWARAAGWRSRDGQTAQHLAADAVRPSQAFAMSGGPGVGNGDRLGGPAVRSRGVAIGGGVSGRAAAVEPVEAALREYLRCPTAAGWVVPAALGQEAGLSAPLR